MATSFGGTSLRRKRCGHLAPAALAALAVATLVPRVDASRARLPSLPARPPPIAASLAEGPPLLTPFWGEARASPSPESPGVASAIATHPSPLATEGEEPPRKRHRGGESDEVFVQGLTEEGDELDVTEEGDAEGDEDGGEETSSFARSVAAANFQANPRYFVGDWLPVSPRIMRKYEWLYNARDFGPRAARTLSDGQQLWSFGGSSSVHHYAWMCTDLWWHGDMLAAPWRTRCAGVGCECVVNPMAEHGEMLAREHGLDASALWCRLTPGPSLSWEIAASRTGAALFKIALMPHNVGNPTRNINHPFGLAMCLTTKKALAAMATGGQWRLDCPDAAPSGDCMHSLGKVSFHKSSRTHRGMFFGFKPTAEVKLSYCARLGWRDGAVWGEALPWCKGSACDDELYNRLFSAGVSRSPGAECRIVPDDATTPTTLSVDFFAQNGKTLLPTAVFRRALR